MAFDQTNTHFPDMIGWFLYYIVDFISSIMAAYGTIIVIIGGLMAVGLIFYVAARIISGDKV